MKRVPRVRIAKTLCGLWLFCLFSLCLSASASASASAYEREKETEGEASGIVRVFYPLEAGFTERDENGNYSGYAYEYLMRIAQLTGWKYEFITLKQTKENHQAGINGVKSGTIDLASNMVQLSNSKQEFLYSSKSAGATQFTLIALKENVALNSRTVDTYPNLRVALVEKEVQQAKLLDEFCVARGLRYEPVYGKDNATCQALVKSGAADVTVAEDISSLRHFKTVLSFASQPFYFATGKDNQALMAELDRAMTAIGEAHPALQQELHNKYFGNAADGQIALTQAESEYVSKVPPIQVLVPVNRAPIQSYDPGKGAFSGILIDVLDLISEKSGLTFSLVRASTRAEGLSMVDNGVVDMVAGVPHSFSDPEALFSSSMVLTSPVLSLPVVRANRTAGGGEGKGILVYSGINLFQDREDVRFGESTQAILQEVEEGKCSEAYVDGYTARHYLEAGWFHDISLTPTPYSQYPVCLGVSRAEDPRLVSVLEQAISLLTQEEIENVIYENTSHPHLTGLMAYMQNNPAVFVISGFLILATVTVLLFLLFLKSRRINRLITEEKRRYQAISRTDGLTQLLNGTAFRKFSQAAIDHGGDNGTGALLFIDVDRFKSINDTYGHLAGDNVLINLASLLKVVFQGDGILGRLGGDEFCVLLQCAWDRDIVEGRCQELMRGIHNRHEDMDITLSIGVVMFKGRVEFEALVHRADAALYRVKQNGRANWEIRNFEELTHWDEQQKLFSMKERIEESPEAGEPASEEITNK